MKTVAVVFGLGPAGLFLSRILSRAGYFVVGIAREDDIGQFSKQVDELVVSTNAEEIISSLEKIRNASCAQIVGHIASDQYLTMVLSNRSRFESLMSFCAPGLDILERFNDKDSAYALMEGVGVPVPKKERLEGACSKCIALPAVIKPRAKRLGETSKVVEKVKVVEDEDEFKAVIDEIMLAGEALEDFTCEQMIPGENYFELGYGGYAERGRMVVDVVVRQVGQYPQGIACTAIEVEDESLANKARGIVAPLLVELEYTGFVHFDIKENPGTGELFVLDVNPRVWGSVGILARKYESLERLLIEGEGSPVKTPGLICWHSPLKELLALVSGKGKKSITPPARPGTDMCLTCMTSAISRRSSASPRSECRSCCAGERHAASNEVSRHISKIRCLEAA